MGSETPIPLSHIRVNIALTQPAVLQKQKIDVGMAPVPAYAFLINVLSSLATSGQKKERHTTYICNLAHFPESIHRLPTET
jgi:hypothetical protein